MPPLGKAVCEDAGAVVRSTRLIAGIVLATTLVLLATSAIRAKHAGVRSICRDGWFENGPGSFTDHRYPDNCTDALVERAVLIALVGTTLVLAITAIITRWLAPRILLLLAAAWFAAAASAGPTIPLAATALAATLTAATTRRPRGWKHPPSPALPPP